MPLRAIVRALGGDLYDGGRRANVPAPGHSPRDRSVSLFWTGERVVAHGFGAADWREILDDLRARGLIDATGAPVGAGVASPIRRTSTERVATALSLWSGGRALAGTLAERHLRLRGAPAASISPRVRRSSSTSRQSAAPKPCATSRWPVHNKDIERSRGLWPGAGTLARRPPS